MAFGEIVREKDGVKRVSATRQKSYISQVTSSRVVAPTKQDHASDDAGGNDDHDDAFFKEQSEFDKAAEENTTPAE